MVSRLKFRSSGTAPAAPAADSNWEQLVSIWARFPSTTLNSGTALTDFSDAFGSTSTSDTGWSQFITEQLSGDQSISGTCDIVLLCNESAASANLYLALIVWVMKPDGTARGTLKVQTTNTGGTEMGTARRTRIWSGLSLNTVNALDGDRIVIELGARGLTPASGSTGMLRWGDPVGASDLALTSGIAGETEVPWIEFSQTLVFASAAPASGEGEGEGYAEVVDGTSGTFAQIDGAGEGAGEGQALAEGEAQLLPQGEGSGEGQALAEGEAQLLAQGEGSGEGQAQPEGLGELLAAGEGEGEGFAEVVDGGAADPGAMFCQGEGAGEGSAIPAGEAELQGELSGGCESGYFPDLRPVIANQLARARPPARQVQAVGSRAQRQRIAAALEDPAP